LEQNYSNKIGEIDIVAKQGEAIVFVEVKVKLSEIWIAKRSCNCLQTTQNKNGCPCLFKTEKRIKFEMSF
jgi:Holliday junction resolvase-like predicted endonuclease